MSRRRPQGPAGILLALLLACVPWVHAAGPMFELDATGLDASQRDATHALLAEAVSRLPAVWQESLEPGIRVRWDDGLPATVHGRAIGNRMLLQRGLLDEWMARPAGVSKGGGTHPALVAVIHELAHFHDRSAAGGLARDARLLDLAGWQVRPFRLLPRLGTNAFSDRSPDPYELADPSEFVAVNLEHWVLDPEYPCRRPALAGTALRCSPWCAQGGRSRAAAGGVAAGATGVDALCALRSRWHRGARGGCRRRRFAWLCRSR